MAGARRDLWLQAGIDIASHENPLTRGGRTIVVLPEGIAPSRIKKTIRNVKDRDRVSVISFARQTQYAVADRAMDGNKLLVGLRNPAIVLGGKEAEH
jgi:predicted Rossmann fold nucleotide-binding protein DprA/Smf involved in DNA uptake